MLVSGFWFLVPGLWFLEAIFSSSMARTNIDLN